MGDGDVIGLQRQPWTAVVRSVRLRYIRGSMMPCPRCRSHLHGVRTPAGRVWDCPQHHGRFALLGVLRGMVRRQELDAAWQTAFWGKPKPGCRCPSCQRSMAEVEVGKVHLDICRRCQAVWIDQDELATLPAPERVGRPATLSSDAHAALAMARVSALQRRHHEGEAIGGAPDEDWKKIVGILGLPVEIGAMGTRQLPWATWTLCGVLIVLGLFFITGDLSAIVRAYGFIPAEPFRLGGLTWITAFFIHGGIGHLLGNLWFLWMMGDNVEDLLGRRRYLLLLLAATVCGSFVHLLWEPRGDIPCIGASGGISGVMAAYALRFPQAQIGIAFFWGHLWLRLPAWAWLGAWLIGQCVLAWQQVGGYTNVSALAHLGGAGIGAVLAWWWHDRRPWTEGVAVESLALIERRNTAGDDLRP